MSRVRNDLMAGNTRGRTIVRASTPRFYRVVTSSYYILLPRYPVTPPLRVFFADLLLAKMVDRSSPLTMQRCEITLI